MFSATWDFFNPPATTPAAPPGAVVAASQTVDVPFTPWFIPTAATEVDATDLTVSAGALITQYDNIRPVVDFEDWDITYGDRQVFGGFERYLQSDYEQHYLDLSDSYSTQRVYEYTFAESPDEAGWTFEDSSVGDDLGWNVGLIHAEEATATDFTNFYLSDNYPSAPEIVGRSTTTLSTPITLAMLVSILDEWLIKTKSYRQTTGSTDAIAHATESTDGKASARAFVMELDLPTFTGDEAIYNGNFSGWACIATLRNTPKAYGEITTTSTWPNYRRGNSGAYGYPNGHEEITLSDEVTDVWSDTQAPWGEFTEADPFVGCPQTTQAHYSIRVQPNEHQELTLISRTGRQYRVTLEAITSAGPGDPPEVIGEVVMVTDELTKKATYVGVAIDYEDAYTLIPTKIEVYQGADWFVVADVAEEQDVAGLIGTNVNGEYLLLQAMKHREGTTFGFGALDGSGSRYRTKHVDVELTTPTYSADGDTWTNGTPPPTGSVVIDFTQTYHYGLQYPVTEVTEWSKSLDGTTVTLGEDQLAITIEESHTYDVSEVYDDFLSLPNTVSLTPTFRRKERTTALVHLGHSAVRRDVLNTYGPVTALTGSYSHDNPDFISEEWIPFTATWDGTKNVADPITIDVPDAGTTKVFAGIRLTYDPPL